MVTENWWPAKQSEKIGKAYIEVMKKYPNDKSIEKPVVDGAIWPDNQEMHSITIVL